MPNGSGHEYDVFVSYAHADDEKPEGSSAKYGWVTTLARNLNTGPNHYRKNLFIDHRLKPGDIFNEDLVATVGNSTLLLLLLSQNYIDSTWCGKELDHFIRTHANNHDKPADVFVVELFPFETFSNVPVNIWNLRKRLIHAQFWHQPVDASAPLLAGNPTPKESGPESERHYWQKLHELRNAVDSRLRVLCRDKQTIFVTTSAEDVSTKTHQQKVKEPLGTILLADTTEDLVPMRSAVKARLEPEGIVVLPEGDYVGLTREELEAELARDLAKSQLFVQLLSPTVGRTGKGYAAPLPQLQFDRASSAKLPIMQWCERQPGSSDIADSQHARLFNTAFLRVTNRTAFEDEIVARLHVIRQVAIADTAENRALKEKNSALSQDLRVPYVGLRPFTEREALLFFGREQHVHELLAKFEGKQRFVAVLGASGTGKSSLVRAGLVPTLRRGALTSAGSNWNVCVFKPGGAPLTNLAQALTEQEGWRDSDNCIDAVASLSATLATSPLALTELYHQKTEHFPGQALLLVVDQFEEIFRYRQQNVDEAEAFINLLLRSASEDVPIYVVMTMRSDFLDNCVTFFGLPEAINHGIYLTPRLGPDQLKLIIASPLVRVGREIDPVLVNRLVNALGGEDELPILEHALLRMWNRAQAAGRTKIETEDFEVVCASHDGQVGQAQLAHAIDNHASEIYDQLSSLQQHIARRMFLALVERRDGQEVRRPQTVRQLVESINERERENVLAVVEVFRAEQAGFLLPPVSTSLNDDRMIDISHESLFRRWHLFRQWLNEESLDVLELMEWQRRAASQKKGGGWLDEYDGERAQRWLARVNQCIYPMQWAERYVGEATYGEVNRYIEESVERVTQSRAEQVRLERQAKEERILRLASQCQHAVTRVLSETLSLDEAVPKIIQAVSESLEWDLGIFWGIDKQAGTLRWVDHWRVATRCADEIIVEMQSQVFKPGVGLPGQIWETGTPGWIKDVAQDSAFVRANLAAKAGLHAAFGFPVRIGGEIEGIIEFFSHEVREPDGELISMITDVASKIGQFGERTRAEEALRQTEARLRQAQKMEVIGRLAGGISHDFNNLLTVIRGYSELVLNRLKAGDVSYREMEEVKKAADRAAGLTSQLLAFSRRQFVAAKVVDLNAILTNMEGMLRRLLGEDIVELSIDIEPKLGAIKADPGQIEQVIMNLAVNARDAMPVGGNLIIETRNVLIDRNSSGPVTGLEEGAYICLIIKDNGQGMSEETQTHLFEPFFSTKEKGRGTGLGLSIVYGIVKRSGGTISIDSKLGQGTKCKIYFPRVDDTAEGMEAAQGMEVTGGTPSRPVGGETILVVEDDPSVRGLVQETLRLSGYEVLVARHGIEALLAGAKHLSRIHLLLTDVAMPQMSGPEVAEKLIVVRPELKVLYMSGYPDHPAFEQKMGKRKTPFLQKPFTPNTLIQWVRAVLDGKEML